MSDLSWEKETNENNITEEATEKQFNLKKEVLEWFYTIIIALLIAFVIKGFLFDIVRVDGHSMDHTLTHNDRLVVTKLFYEPEFQDIVILDSTYKKRMDFYKTLEDEGKTVNFITKPFIYNSLPNNLKKRYYVKRIIALPGQTVDIKNGHVYVDGELIDEPYTSEPTMSTDSSVSYPLTVLEGHVFVMGDNRTGSKDSRASDLGQIPYDAILGKSQIRIWPFNRLGITK